MPLDLGILREGFREAAARLETSGHGFVVHPKTGLGAGRDRVEEAEAR